MRRSWITSASLALLVGTLFAQRSGYGQQPAPPAGSDWPTYRHDEAGTGYSPLRQITAANVATLTRAWSYGLQSDAPPAAGAGGGRGGAAGAVNSQVTPIVVGGVMYLPAANRVVALDPDTGAPVWQSPIAGGAPSRRGLAYWAGEGTTAPRVLLTSGRRLIALEARTGALAAGFGTNG